MNDPALAFVAALLFMGGYVHHRVLGWPGFRPARLVVLAVACVWLLYAVYELSVQREVRPENVPIRVDSALIGPALIVLSCLGGIAYLFGFSRQPKNPPRMGASESERPAI